MLNILDFGGDASGVGANDAAFAAALASVTANPNGAYRGGPRLFFPPGKYRFDDSIQLKKTVILEGCGTGQEGGQATVLQFPVDTHGIIVHRYNTIGDTVESPTTTAGDASIIRNMQIRGTKTGTVGHGIWLRARATVEQVYVQDFAENGIHVVAASGGGGSFEGNANNFHITYCRINGCNRHGLYIDGTDANAGVVTHLDCSGNGGWGVYDSSFLGNLYLGCHTNNNAMKCRVYHNGAYWICGKANTGIAPGTDNRYWYWYASGAAPSLPYYPAWDIATAYNEGGSYKTDNINQQTVFVACYAEGSQPNYYAARTMVLGGTVNIGEVLSDSAGTLLYGRNQGATLSKLAMLAAKRDAAGNPIGSIEYELLTEPEQDVIWKVRHPTFGGFYYLRFDAADGGQLSLRTTSSSQAAYNWTLSTTTQTFGRANPVPYATYIQRLFIGSTMSGARQMTMHSGPPTGEAARGDVCWNISPSPGGWSGWRCVAAGNPGTWKGFGLIEA